MNKNIGALIVVCLLSVSFSAFAIKYTNEYLQRKVELQKRVDAGDTDAVEKLDVINKQEKKFESVVWGTTL
ncbi:MAG: hypothetical protein UU47_C0003G0055 [candidate division TM6 bacterium GW2011_GWE2_41_16]|nr:MAG: hypothetical protein UU47_C0003G0055 [candidate division TM6 bacterium GW2011_GWE2_41_16]